MMNMKTIHNRLLSIFIVVALLASVSFAGSFERQGTAGAQELLIPVGSVGTALGGSFNASIHGIEAAYWNPAGLAKIEGSGEAIFSQLSYIADINVMYAGVAAKLGALGVGGFTLKTLNFGDIPVTTVEQTDGTGETYSPRFFTLGLLYSKSLSDRISVGTKLNIINETVMNTSASGVAFNAGVQYEMSRVSIGLSIRNFGLDMLFDGPNLEMNMVPAGTEPGARQEPFRIHLSAFDLPTLMEMGVSSKLIESKDMQLEVGATFLNDNFAFDQYNFGGELLLYNMVALRASYSLAQNPDTGAFLSNSENYLYGLGFGGGLKLKFGGTDLYLDYSSRITALFANNQWLTIRIGF